MLRHLGSKRCPCPAQSWDQAGQTASEAEEKRLSDKRVKGTRDGGEGENFKWIRVKRTNQEMILFLKNKAY